MTTTFTGSRTSTTVGSPWKRLREAFTRYELREFDVSRVGEGVVSVDYKGACSGLMVADGVVRDTGRVVNMPYAETVLSNFVIRNVHATNVDSFIRLKKASSGLVEDCSAVGSERPLNGFPSGCFTADHPTSDITYRRVRMDGFAQYPVPSGYWNGDGFADEEEGRRMRYEQCRAARNADAGLDTKSHEMTAVDFVAEANGRNYRLWGSGTLTDCISIDPRKAHIWVGGGPRLGSYVLERPVFVDGAEAKPHIDIDPRDDYASPVTITVIDPRDGTGALLTEETLRVRGPRNRVEVRVEITAEPAPEVPLDEARVRAIVAEELFRRGL